MRKIVFAALGAALLGTVAPAAFAQSQTGSVIFFHPDGMGVNHWGAVRMSTVGPDGRTNWDRLPGTAVYLGHMKDALTGTSHGGATTHAYGVKVKADSFGLDGAEPITARSGKTMSLLEEAKEAGMATALVQSGAIYEPGTAAFVASTERRDDHGEIARQVIESGVPVILGGGEGVLLPKGTQGRFGEGRREDGVNLVERAKELGYTIVYTAQELKALDPATPKVLGVFAHVHTFHDEPEEALKAAGKPLYVETAPTVGEMADWALQSMRARGGQFMMIVEEEGTDNFGNRNNAKGFLEAGRRADEAIGVIERFVTANPQTLMVMTADSDAGGLQVIGPWPGRGMEIGKPLDAADKNGAPLDGQEGTGTIPFVSAPDRNGVQHPFAISWSTLADTSGGILVRGVGMNADKVRGTMDNSEVYGLMYETLFGRSVM